MAITFVRMEKHYPDYIGYMENGKSARIHIDDNNEITIYGVSGQPVKPSGQYSSAFSRFPVTHALCKMLMCEDNQYWKDYYTYADSCLSLNLIPIYHILAINYFELGITPSMLVKITQKHKYEDIEMEVCNAICNKMNLTEEEKVIFIRYIKNGNSVYRELYFSSKKFRNLVVKMMTSSCMRVIGEYEMFSYILQYIKNLKIADMEIETGDFWTNYIKAEATVNAILKAQENAVFMQNQTSKPLAYENDTFSVIVPTTRQELIEEGKALNNCLGGIEWDNFLKDGKRYVVFIRRKDNIEHPYIACDFNLDGIIIQFLTYNNTLVHDDDALIFKKEYQKYLRKICK